MYLKSVCIDVSIDRKYMYEIVVLVCFILIWILFPMPTLFLMFISLYYNSFFLKYKRFLFLFISLTFSLIAYTQKSISGTDIERYYGMFSYFASGNLESVDFSFYLIDNLYYVFNPMSVYIVSIFHNVQFFSLFWVFIVYYFYFLSCNNYVKYRNIVLTHRQFLLFLLVSVFGIVLFTQVTEIIKQAVATSIYFYAFTLFLLGKNFRSIIWVIISIGIHSTPLFLLPLFFYRYFNKGMIRILVIVSIILSYSNIMELIMSVLPNSGIFLLLYEKAASYTDEMSEMTSSLLRYDLLLFISLFMTFILKKTVCDFRCPSKLLFLFLIYFSLVFANRNMVHNYIRFVNMSFAIYAFLYLELLQANFTSKALKMYINSGIVVAFCVSFIHMTYYRTVGGGYLSSYMDNSLVNIFLSSLFNYLSFVAY